MSRLARSAEIPVYAYFYPLSRQCPERQARAAAHGYELADETRLCQEAQPLYQGHRQPMTYCLGNTVVRNWDDADPEAMAAQIDLAGRYGVDGFIFNSYLGQKNGRRIHEMQSVVRDGFLGAENSGLVRFAVMAALGSPRVMLPVRPGMAFQEEGRNYERSRGTAETIIDTCARQYWEQDNYIRMGREGRPYLSIYASDAGKQPAGLAAGELSVAGMVGYMKEYSQRRYKIEPYVVGVLKTPAARTQFEGVADATTGYAFLPDFASDAEPLQDYGTLLERRMVEWDEIADGGSAPYVPPAVVAWDASPRGGNGPSLHEVAGIYPFTPIVTGGSPEMFGRMLREQRDFIMRQVPPDDRYTPVTAWNEVTEGPVLLPRVYPDGSLDAGYLDMLQAVRLAEGAS